MSRVFLFIALLLAACVGLAQDDTRLRASAEEPLFVLDESTKRMLDRSQAFIEELPDGRIALNANGGHQHVYMARIGKDGKIETFCADNIHAAEAFLRPDNRGEVPK